MSELSVPNPNAQALVEAPKSMRAKSAVVAAGLLLAACTGNGEGEDRRTLDLSDDTFAEACAVQPLTLAEYSEAVGSGPYEANAAFQAETPDNDEVLTEFMEELPQNTLGVALASEFLKQQTADYAIRDVIGSASESFNLMMQNDAARDEACQTVLETVAAEGEVFSLTATELLEARNSYDEDGNLVGLQYEIVDSQDTIDVITVRDENGAARWGKVVSEERNGRFVIILQEGDLVRDTEEDGEPEDHDVEEVEDAPEIERDATTEDEQDDEDRQDAAADRDEQEDERDEAPAAAGPAPQPDKDQAAGGKDDAGQADKGAGADRGKGPGGDDKADDKADDGRGGEPGGDGPGCEGVGKGCPGEGPGGDDKQPEKPAPAPKPEPAPVPEKPKPKPEPEKPEEPKEPPKEKPPKEEPPKEKPPKEEPPKEEPPKEEPPKEEPPKEEPPKEEPPKEEPPEEEKPPKGGAEDDNPWTP